ncbi:hypothetical protein BgiMline_011569, partial [Biomphalaria glabrata]
LVLTQTTIAREVQLNFENPAALDPVTAGLLKSQLHTCNNNNKCNTIGEHVVTEHNITYSSTDHKVSLVSHTPRSN